MIAGKNSTKSRLQIVRARRLCLQCFGFIAEVSTADLQRLIVRLVLASRGREYEGSDKCPIERHSYSAHTYELRQAACHGRSYRVMP